MAATCDEAELPRASVEDHPSDHFLTAWCPQCDHAVDAVCPDCRSRLEPAGATTDGAAGSSLSHPEFYRKLVDLIYTARNSKFLLGCYLIAIGDAYAEGISMQEYAKAWGVTRATVSKQCHLICAALGIRPSRYMRKEEVSAKFRMVNRRPRKYEPEAENS